MKGRRRLPGFVQLGRVILWLWVGFDAFLFLWVVSQSFRNGAEIFTRPFELPVAWNLSNYFFAFVTSGLGTGFVNSVLVAGSASAVAVGMAGPAAYVLSRSRGRSAGPLIILFAIGLGIPLQAVIVPIFEVMRTISDFMQGTVGWWDDRVSLFLIYVASSLPFTVFLLTAFFRSLPGDLEEAAALDGASPLRTFTAVVWPLAMSGLMTAFLLNFLGLWNETLLALVLLTSNDVYTLPRALLSLYQTMEYTSNWGALFAGMVISVVPTLVIFSVAGGRIMKGITLGSTR